MVQAPRKGPKFRATIAARLLGEGDPEEGSAKAAAQKLSRCYEALVGPPDPFATNNRIIPLSSVAMERLALGRGDKSWRWPHLFVPKIV